LLKELIVEVEANRDLYNAMYDPTVKMATLLVFIKAVVKAKIPILPVTKWKLASIKIVEIIPSLDNAEATKPVMDLLLTLAPCNVAIKSIKGFAEPTDLADMVIALDPEKPCLFDPANPTVGGCPGPTRTSTSSCRPRSGI